MAKIFLVEDNPDHALLISRALEGSGDEVARFHDGVSILDFFKKELKEEELPVFVLLDLKLPGMDGFEILQAIRAHLKYRLIPVVILTTSKHQREINRAYELGASGFVTKSEDFSQLTEKLARVKAYWLKTVELPESGQANP